MTDRLFQHSWQAAWQSNLQRATEEVKKLNRNVFSEPGLAGKLQKIAQQFSLDVARVNKDAVSAKAREDETVIHDYGESRVLLSTLCLT